MHEFLGEPESVKQLADLFRSVSIPDFDMVVFDIEIKCPPDVMPIPEIAQFPLLTVGVYDSISSRIYTMRPVSKQERAELYSNLEYQPDIYNYDDEREFIQDLLCDIAQFKYNLTYNGDNFDYPYLINRARKLRIESGITGNSSKGYQLKNSIHIDLYRIFKNEYVRRYLFNNKYSRSRLDDISQALLFSQKVEYDVWFDEMDTQTLLRYTIQDVKLTYELAGMVMGKMSLIAGLTNQKISVMSRQQCNKWVESLLERVVQKPVKDKIRRARDRYSLGRAMHWGGYLIELRELYPAIIIQNNISLDPDNRLKDLISYLSIMKEDEYRLMLSALIDTLFDKSSVYYQQSLVDEMYIHADKLLKDYTEKIVYRTSRVVYFSELDINRFKAWSIVNFGIAPQIIEVNFLMVNDYRYLANTNRGIIQFNLLRNRFSYPEIIQNMMEYVLVILELGDGLETTVEMVSQIIDNTRYNMENGAWELLTMSAVLSENIKSTSLRGKSVQLALQTGRFRLGTQFTYVYCKPFTITLERDISKFLKKGDGIPCEVAEIGTEYELDRARYLDLLGEVIKYIAPFINYRMTNI